MLFAAGLQHDTEAVIGGVRNEGHCHIPEKSIKLLRSSVTLT